MSDAKSVFMLMESDGTYGLVGPPPYKDWKPMKKYDEETRFVLLSDDGKYFLVSTKNSQADIWKTEDGSLKCVLPYHLAKCKFSSQSRFVAGLDQSIAKGDAENFHIWSLDGELSEQNIPKIIYSQKHSGFPEFQFSSDDNIYGRLSNDGRVLFYETTNFHKEVLSTPHDLKVSEFSFGQASGGQLVYLCYIKGGKQQGTSSIKLYKYPNVSQVIAQRSSFQSDRVKIKWNQRGTAVLVTTITDVDKTGKSYYGNISLEYLDVKGIAYKVQLNAGTDKDGRPTLSSDLHACQWSPNSTEFCVIMGKMPNVRAVIMNSKGEVVLDMGIDPRNTIHFNPQGNLVLLSGIGNLPGTFELWEVKRHKKLIANFKAIFTTHVNWLSDGSHFMTATCAPRMQIENGFKVWDFTGKLVYEWVARKHLFEIIQFPVHGDLPPFPDTKLDAHVKAIQKVNLKPEIEAYVPSSKRTGPVGMPIMKAKPTASQKAFNASGGGGAESTKDKEIRNIKRKIEAIEKLKTDRDEGKHLEKNQLEKIEGEDALLKKLAELSAS